MDHDAPSHLLHQGLALVQAYAHAFFLGGREGLEQAPPHEFLIHPRPAVLDHDEGAVAGKEALPAAEKRP
jgi:hypothetical protein